MEEALMDNPIEEKVREMQDFLLNRPWWELILRGIFIMIFGILAIAYPDLTLAVFVIFFGAFVFIEGIFQMVGAFAAKAENPQWALMFISGLFSFMIGVIVLAWPGMSALVLLYFIGAWFLISGTVQLVFGLRAIGDGTKAGVHIVGGILGIMIGMLAFIWPGATAMSIIWIIGLFAIFFGIQLIALGFLSRSEGSPVAAEAAA
ncbi:MAG: HdeD family acid-resistance protein [Thermoplasmata archaeon]|nr:HdeD family acid-resistance protein [Thermoplasmata archaeon]